MNPRHRRLSFPWRWPGCSSSSSSPPSSTNEPNHSCESSPGCGATCSIPDTLVRAVASGRQKGTPAAVAPGRAAVRRPQGGAPPAGHGVRRHPGAHRQPPGRRRGRDAVDDAARRAVRQLARRDHDPDPPAAGDQEARGGRAHRRPGRRRSRPDRGHDRDKERLLPEDDPVLVALGISDARGADQAEPAGEVPPGRGVPAAARRVDHRGDRRGHAAHGPRPRTRCGSSTSAAATPT